MITQLKLVLNKSANYGIIINFDVHKKLFILTY